MARASTRIAGRYELEKQLGHGGMGEVWQARHLALRTRVAVKLLHGAFAADEAMRTRFLHEARVTAQLKTRHAVQVFDFGISDDGEAFLVMELLEGETLALRLRRVTRLSPGETVVVIAQAARALDQAHGLGIVHRDLKPENLFIAEDDERRLVTKVVDFGIAKLVGTVEEERTTSAHLATTAPSTLTKTGIRLGTPYYMAPEQVEASPTVGPATDVWALGVVAYECLTGRRPFEGPDVAALFACIRGGVHPPARLLNRALPEAFDAWFDRACARDGEARFASASEAARELSRALGVAEPAESVRPPPSGLGSPDAPLSATETATDAVVLAETPPRPREDEGKPKRRRPPATVLAALGGAVLLVAGAIALGARASRALGVASPLDANDALLACPILDAHGTGDDDGWLGAAAATIACRRAGWLMGGKDERLLLPQQLLDLPISPGDDFPHAPFDGPDVRGRALAAARSRAPSYLDGTVSLADYAPTVSLRLVRASDGAEIAHAEATGASLAEAVDAAVDRLAAERAIPRRTTIDPGVAAFTFLRDVDTALVFDDLQRDISTVADCQALLPRQDELGPAAVRVAYVCHWWAPELDAAVRENVLDRSSPGTLAATAARAPEARTPEGAAALARELGALRGAEPSALGRAALAVAESWLWKAAGDDDLARAVALAATREDPRYPGAWIGLLQVVTALAHDDVAADAAAAWVPDDMRAISGGGSWSSQDSAERLRYARRKYLLRPTWVTSARTFGQALAEVGRVADARAIAASLVSGRYHDERAASTIWARVDAREAKFGASLDRVRHPAPCDHLNTALPEIVILSTLLGRQREVADEWGRWVLADDKSAGCYDSNGEQFMFALLMHASPDIARPSLAAVAAHHGPDWAEGSEAMLAGARLFVEGDLRGAASAWAPLVASHQTAITLVLPVAALQAAGRDDLGARADAVSDRYPWLAGLPASAARQAQRALATGDRAAAVAMAQRVIDAWGVADAPVSAVEAMRALTGGGR